MQFIYKSYLYNPKDRYSLNDLFYLYCISDLTKLLKNIMNLNIQKPTPICIKEAICCDCK